MFGGERERGRWACRNNWGCHAGQFSRRPLWVLVGIGLLVPWACWTFLSVRSFHSYLLSEGMCQMLPGDTAVNKANFLFHGVYILADKR